MTMTIQCSECDWVTDIEETSDTNPSHCPECMGQLLYAGTNVPLYRDGEFNEDGWE